MASKITILGAGITGLAIASQLPKEADITIYGKFLPGDEMDKEYVSQWAGAIWLGVHATSAREQKYQMDSYSTLWQIAGLHPESSARRIEITEIQDIGVPEQVWYRDHVVGFRYLSKSELPKGAKFGMKWQTVVISPPTFINWFRGHLENQGVKFKRLHVKALRDLEGLGHDVLINASGFGSTLLEDVRESAIIPVRQQNIRLRKEGYNKLFIRRGENNYYSTAFGRDDGSIYIGGVKKENVREWTASAEDRKLIMKQAHDNQPDVFPSADPNDYDLIGDHVGVWPIIKQDKGGIRLEKEVIGGQKVVHAYGQEAGGYVCSFGIAREAARLVFEYLSDPARAKL
ncbi:hypothetical protein LTR84_005790 [Exophiala bonariae]|uniref:FAD dependent oxidoreductase domain-containing protein n=1 Tax=Exophiala bonariae TaxID=1690606 RepID=A0AAV9N7K4_9EURO|nr:hypothetical protein LTR84_005790 [Exophiala bonariae]